MVQLCATPQPRPALALARDLSPHSQNRQVFVVALCVKPMRTRVRRLYLVRMKISAFRVSRFDDGGLLQLRLPRKSRDITYFGLSLWML